MKKLYVTWIKLSNSKRKVTGVDLGLVMSCRLFKKGDYTSAVQSYKMSLRYCPLEDEYNKDRVITLC